MQTVTNMKTGNIGVVVGTHNRMSDGKSVIEVRTLAGQKAYWLASACKE